MKKCSPPSNTELARHILSEFAFEPSVKIRDIGVVVKAGVATLTGHAANDAEKSNAVSTARRMAGLLRIADHIQVTLPKPLLRTDSELANAATNQVAWSAIIPNGKTQITVSQGWITLKGEVDWRYQKNAAEQAVQHLAGVRGVKNLMTIKPQASRADVKSAIKNAFAGQDLVDSEKIEVDLVGHEVLLSGSVRNSVERDEAERVAWAAQGVLSVNNQLKVEWSWGFTN
jgi:osmotically-inducible protein OsmY